MGAFQSAVSVTASAVAEQHGIPYLAADSSSPSLHRRNLNYFFRAAAHDEMFSVAMFDFMDAQRAKGHSVKTLGLFYEDSIYGTDWPGCSASSPGIEPTKWRRTSSIVDAPSLAAEVQQIKKADPDVLMPSSLTADAILLAKTMGELGCKPRNIIAQGAGFSEKAVYDAAGDKLAGLISRTSFSLDLAAKRPPIARVNSLFKAKAGKDLNDNTARQLMALLILADAIDRAKSVEGAKIREALARTDIPGEMTIMPWKRVKFGPTVQNPEADPR